MWQEIFSCCRKFLLASIFFPVTVILFLFSFRLKTAKFYATKCGNFSEDFVWDPKILWELGSQVPRENPTLILRKLSPSWSLHGSLALFPRLREVEMVSSGKSRSTTGMPVKLRTGLQEEVLEISAKFGLRMTLTFRMTLRNLQSDWELLMAPQSAWMIYFPSYKTVLFTMLIFTRSSPYLKDHILLAQMISVAVWHIATSPIKVVLPLDRTNLWWTSTTVSVSCTPRSPTSTRCWWRPWKMKPLW